MPRKCYSITGILVSIDGQVVGVIAISDPLKLGARDVISILKSMNVRSIMVTGDNWGTAHSIAKEVGIEIESVVAEAKPDQKAEKVKELQAKNNSATEGPSTLKSPVIDAEVLPDDDDDDDDDELDMDELNELEASLF